MSILVDTMVKSAVYKNEFIILTMKSGLELRFPIAGNPRLACGTPSQLNNIEVSPSGLQWIGPDIDEDLSFRGLLAGDYEQICKHECKSLLL